MAWYDFIIAGGGAAGLALVYQMSASPLRGSSILIVDREAKNLNDRSWSFWTQRPTPFDHLVYRWWDRAEVISEDYHRAFELAPYQYKLIRGLDYYNGIRAALEDEPEISFHQGRVMGMRDTKDKHAAQVVIDEQYHGARYAFDSTFRLADLTQGPRGYHYLKQHFKGWEIETQADSFDPSTVTLFDLRTPQKDCLRYFSVLPFTRRRALVRYSLFSAELLKPHEYDRSISDYLENIRGIPLYRIASIENGIIPLTDRPLPRKLGERVMTIGTRAGLARPSSGQAFLRIQNDTRAIVESLVNYGHPFQIPQRPGRYRLFDTLMLQLMHRQGGRMKDLLIQLFEHNSIQSIFCFLDEQSGWDENLRLFRSLPAAPLLNALFRAKLLRKI